MESVHASPSRGTEADRSWYSRPNYQLTSHLRTSPGIIIEQTFMCCHVITYDMHHTSLVTLRDKRWQIAERAMRAARWTCLTTRRTRRVAGRWQTRLNVPSDQVL